MDEEIEYKSKKKNKDKIFFLQQLVGILFVIVVVLGIAFASARSSIVVLETVHIAQKDTFESFESDIFMLQKSITDLRRNNQNTFLKIELLNIERNEPELIDACYQYYAKRKKLGLIDKVILNIETIKHFSRPNKEVISCIAYKEYRIESSIDLKTLRVYSKALNDCGKRCNNK